MSKNGFELGIHDRKITNGSQQIKNKMMKITKRDISFFILGILTLFIVERILNWEEVKQDFWEGYHSVRCCAKK